MALMLDDTDAADRITEIIDAIETWTTQALLIDRAKLGAGETE